MEIEISKKQKLTIENFTGNASGHSFDGIRFRTGKAKKKTILHFGINRVHQVIEALEHCLSNVEGNHQGGFYNSPQWLKLRYEALKKYRQCCLCGSTDSLECDHVKPRSLFPELELNPSNLQILCKRCNSAKSNNDSEDYR